MKLKLTIIIAFLSLTTFGQLTGKVKGVNINKPTTINDTVVKVAYNFKKVSNNYAAVFFNGKLINYSLMSTINPESIATMNVVKKDTIIDSVKYNGRIIIEGKISYNHNFMPLNKFKLKYINPSENATVFQIDGNVIYEDYDSYLIDEKYILKAIVSTIDNPKEKIKLNIINLLTKSAKNIENSNRIILR
jgi:hypothetical protein